MALKIFCDICGKEIGPDSEAGKWISVSKKLPVYLDKETGTRPTFNTEVQLQEDPPLLLCEECKAQIDKKLKELKEKFQNESEKKR